MRVFKFELTITEEDVRGDEFWEEALMRDGTGKATLSEAIIDAIEESNLICNSIRKPIDILELKEYSIVEEYEYNYKSLHLIFKELPKLGFGDPKDFKGSKEDLSFAHDILETLGSGGIIFKRSDYLEGGGELNIDEWFDLIKKEDTFQSWMLANFPFQNGEFVFSADIDELEKIATKYIKLSKI